MSRYLAVLASVLAVAVVSPAVAQGPITARSAVMFESYKFDPGLVFNKVVELTVPIGLGARLGNFGSVALSSGYAKVDLTSADPSQLPSQTISGLLDTEARLSINLVPGKLLLLMSGAVPTGTKTVQQEQLAILGALSSDVIGFSAANLGTGGNVGGGFAGAIPVGRFAVGFGATYRLPLTYQPVIGQTRDLKPGAEIRVRGGLEGALARRTYLRMAGIYARTSKDQVNAATVNGIGNRIIGYISLNQTVGSTTLTLYGFDVFRGSPQIEATATGAALLPRGNLLAGGFRADVGVGRTVTLSPRVEYRTSSAAPDPLASALEFLGRSFRAGVDARFALSRSVAAVIQAGGAFGTFARGPTDVPFNGYRGGVHLEITP